MTSPDVLHAILRTDLAAFIQKTFQAIDGSQPYHPNWHVKVLADYLTKVRLGQIKRLIITLPPRSLKSVAASVAFPAWVLGHDPTRRIMCASYGRELSSKLGRDCRTVMQSDWYLKAFPNTRLNDNRSAADDFETTANGFRFSTSVGGVMTGRGGSLLILDDVHKADEVLSDAKRLAVTEWFTSALLSRLDNKQNGAIVLIMQRLHVDDLAGYLLEQGGWVHLNLPAIAETDESFILFNGRKLGRRAGEALNPVLEPLEVLEQTKLNMGSFWFSAQYQQQPVPAAGNLFKKEWFKTYDRAPEPDYSDQIFQSWDTALTATQGANYSVCTTWVRIDEEAYLIDVFRAKLELPDLKRTMLERQQKFGAGSVLIEESVAGLGLIQQLRHEGKIHPIAIKPVGSKLDRAGAAAPIIEAGRVYIPREAPWLGDFMNEVLAFPAAKNDDQVDSMTQFVNWMAKRQAFYCS